MGAEIPKVLLPVGGKPMVLRLLEAVREAGVDPRPLIVVSKNGEDVKKVIGDGCEYVVQEEQLGTGHAVLAAESALRGKADAVIVLYGDHPNLRAETIRTMAEVHEEARPKITMMTATVPDFEEWRKPLYDFGRVVRDAEGRIQESIERKDATPEQLAIKEVNPCFYCFDAAWLWAGLKKIGNRNAQKEYYLTDLVRIAIREGEEVRAVSIDPLETLGVNTPEQLEIVKKLI